MISSNNPLRQLESFGPSVWLDYLRRDFVGSAKFRRMIEEDGLKDALSRHLSKGCLMPPKPFDVLNEVGSDLIQIGDEMQQEGVESFDKSLADLLATIERRAALLAKQSDYPESYCQDYPRSSVKHRNARRS